MQNNRHIPGRPTTPQPPQLNAIADSLRHPAIVKSGITTTHEGQWALLVVVKSGTPLPIEEVEAKCAGFPVIYKEDQGRIPIARPAYPGLGE
jgi:hypothetical protein